MPRLLKILLATIVMCAIGAGVVYIAYVENVLGKRSESLSTPAPTPVRRADANANELEIVRLELVRAESKVETLEAELGEAKQRYETVRVQVATENAFAIKLGVAHSRIRALNEQLKLTRDLLRHKEGEVSTLGEKNAAVEADRDTWKGIAERCMTPAPRKRKRCIYGYVK